MSNVEKCITQWNRIENQNKNTKNVVKLYWQGSSQKKKVQGKPDIHLIKNEVASQSMYKHQLKIDSRNNDYIWKYETLRKIQYHDIACICHWFLDIALEAQGIKGKIDRWDCIKF